MYFESHAHYDDTQYDGDREALIASLAENGVDTVINIGSDMRASAASVALASQYPFFYAAVGVHPDCVADMTQADIETLTGYAADPKVVAIGEIGLDYYRHEGEAEIDRDRQKFWFREQLALAKKLNLPIVVHSRDAAEDTFETVAQGGVRRGVIHCYSGSAQMAMDYVKMGFHIGVGGVVTFKNARRLVESVEAVPIERILIETDCPYLSPEPKRGMRNDSTRLKYIVERIAQIKGFTHDEVAKITHENAERMFGV